MIRFKVLLLNIHYGIHSEVRDKKIKVIVPLDHSRPKIIGHHQ